MSLSPCVHTCSLVEHLCIHAMIDSANQVVAAAQCIGSCSSYEELEVGIKEECGFTGTTASLSSFFNKYLKSKSG